MKNNKVKDLNYTENNWYLHPQTKDKDQIFTVKSNLNFNTDRRSKIFASNNREEQGKNNEVTQNRSRLRNFIKCVEGYMETSTLHGLRYVGDSTITYGERLFWLASFIIAVTCAVYFIISIYVRYNINPVIVSMNPTPTPVEEIPYPAVTICNMNAALKSESEKIVAEGTPTERSFLDDICELDNTLHSSSSSAIDNQTGNWKNVFKFMSRVSQPCDKMLKACRWRLKDTDCKSIFNQIATDQGMCCTFNLLPLNYILRNPGNKTQISSAQTNYHKYDIDDWSPERGYLPNASYEVFPFRSPGPGAHLGLALVLDADVENYYCSTSSSVGFKMLLHNPAEIPQMSEYAFMLPPGCEIRIVFKPTINDATKTLESVAVSKRHCYFTHERHLKYYRTYTKANCKMECLANITLKRCGCVSFYLPRDAATKICGKMQEACSDSVKEMMELKEMSSEEEKLCDCLPACFQLEYDKLMSYGKITNTFKLKKEIIKNESPEYFMKNMAVVQLYFVSSQFNKFTKSELYGFSEFVSNTGGILGLFLGFSILSLVEIVYHCSLKLVCNTIRSKRDNRRKSKTLSHN